MKVQCKNKNTWYRDSDLMCGYLKPRDGEIGIQDGEIVEVTSMFVDKWGDLFYVIVGREEKGWEAEFFDILDDEMEEFLEWSSYLGEVVNKVFGNE